MEVLVPDGVCGNFRVETFTVSPEESLMSSIRRDRVPPGTYKRLMRDRTVVMSNTPMEVRSNRGFVNCAFGSVLINGLGLGMVLGEILKKDNVTKVTVVEKYKEVIQLVGPTFLKDPRVTIIHADALTFKPPAGEKFDVVWHDIWDYITADNLEEMKLLHRKYGRRTQWQGSWEREACEYHKKREERETRRYYGKFRR